MIVGVDQFLSQRWIWGNRYLLSRSTVNDDQYESLRQAAEIAVDMVTPVDLSYSKAENISICDWMQANTIVEPHIYDFDIPAGHVTPISFFPGKSWTMQLYVYDACAPYITHSSIHRHEFVDAAFNLKNQIYMPKAVRIECIEPCWLGYDDIDDCILIHHNQINGMLKGYITENEKLWMHRYMIRMGVKRIAPWRHHHIFVPDAQTFSLFMERKMKHTQVPITAYSRHVLQKSDFTKVPCSVFEEVSPIAASSCDIFNYLDRSEINFWRYEHDNPNTLANACNGAG